MRKKWEWTGGDTNEIEWIAGGHNASTWNVDDSENETNENENETEKGRKMAKKEATQPAECRWKKVKITQTRVRTSSKNG